MLGRRNNNATAFAARNQENQENAAVVLGNNQRLLKSKQQNAAGGSLLPRPATRTALGDIRNRAQPIQPPKDGPGPSLKSNGYGSQIQSRLVNKPEPRRPLRSVSNAAAVKDAKPIADRAGRKTSLTKPLVKSQSAVDAVFVGPVTRAAARKSATPVEEDQVSAMLVEKEPTPEPQLRSEPETEAPSSSISEDIGELQAAASYSTAMITNIDDGDEENPQLVTEYVSDIYSYLRHLESVQAVKADYLSGKEVTGRMRGILVDWLVQVHVRFHLLTETLYMTVTIIDRYLQKAKVSKDQLQLVGVTGMFVASKYEEMYAPEIGDFVYITDSSYTKKQILRMEIEMLRTIEFQLGRPLPIHFLRRFSKAAGADVVVHSLAKYFMELSLVEYAMVHFKPSVLAASALWLAIHLCKEDIKWSSTMVHYTKYEERDLKPCVEMIIKTLLKIHSGKSKLQAVRNKHATSKFQEISKHSCLNLDELKSIVLADQ